MNLIERVRFLFSRMKETKEIESNKKHNETKESHQTISMTFGKIFRIPREVEIVKNATTSLSQKSTKFIRKDSLYVLNSAKKTIEAARRQRIRQQSQPNLGSYGREEFTHKVAHSELKKRKTSSNAVRRVLHRDIFDVFKETFLSPKLRSDESKPQRRKMRSLSTSKVFLIKRSDLKMQLDGVKEQMKNPKHSSYMSSFFNKGVRKRIKSLRYSTNKV